MNRPELVDEHGVHHRHGCPMPGWTSEPSRAVRGVHVLRCPSCGAIRLVTTTTDTAAARLSYTTTTSRRTTS